MLERPMAVPEDLIRCPVCEVYLKKTEGFICSKCKRGPLCKKHKVIRSSECASCLYDRRRKDLLLLKEQEINLKSFLRLLQFLFLVFAVFFIALRSGLEDTVEFLQSSFIKDSLLYLGGIAVFGYIVFYFILYNQRGKIQEAESEIRKVEVRR
jgi:hypothetical protein